MRSTLSGAFALVCSGTAVFAAPNERIEQTILTMERRGMDAWQQGNPDEFLKISDPAITYFHATVEKRLEGLQAVKALYESYRGRPLFDRYEISDPKVTVSGVTAVLTYQLVTQNGALTRRWNATEVYQHGQAGWRIIHSHFSAAKQ